MSSTNWHVSRSGVCVCVFAFVDAPPLPQEDEEREKKEEDQRERMKKEHKKHIEVRRSLYLPLCASRCAHDY